MRAAGFRLLLLVVGLALAVGPAAARSRAPAGEVAVARHGMVASDEARATEIGVEILRQGGNAVDAAVAVGFALAVTLPQAGNLGGGGFMVIHLTGRGEQVAIDYREAAPAAATRDMFLDAQGNVDRNRVRHSHLAAGVPGSVAGLALALERYGTMPLARVMAPAIRLAWAGLEVDEALAQHLAARRELFARWPSSRRIFLRPGGAPWQAGDRLVQADLALSLQEIAEEGAAAFYRGRIAQKIAADMASHGGLVSLADLAAYQVVVREPVVGSYRGYRIVSMPPPSSGGVHLIQLLNMLEAFPLANFGPRSPDGLHLMVEAMKLAYADRSEHLGDPDYVNVPVSGLISKEYAAELRRKINGMRATPSALIRPGRPQRHEGDQTTHYSVVDRHGNAVATTTTLNFAYGSGIVAAGTGILLNNEMDDFVAKPGVPNAYGLVGGDANAVAPGKRPLSSMTPTIVLEDGEPLLVTGSPGGSRIITTVLQLLVNVLDHGMGIGEATRAPRLHHQWQPDVVRLERGVPEAVVKALEARGHKVATVATMGATQTVLRRREGLAGAADPRRPGGLAMGH